jgi:hypothetical protein
MANHYTERLYFLLSPPKGTKTKLNSVVSVRERTIATELPPLVDEDSANFYG